MKYKYIVVISHTEPDLFWGGNKHWSHWVYNGTSFLKAMWIFLLNLRKYDYIKIEREKNERG